MKPATWFLALGTVAAFAVWLAQRGSFAFSPLTASEDVQEADQGPSLLDEAMTAITPSTYMQPEISQAVANGNVQAGLATIRYAEGTNGPDGYRTIFGGGLFSFFDDHPRIAVKYGQLWTTAAGAYQLMAVSALPTGGTTRVNTWDRIKAKLQLPDFSPASQDAAAIELIREQGALGDLMAGRFSDFVRKCAPVWASLPGAGYGQPERSLSNLLVAYQAAGGITSEA